MKEKLKSFLLSSFTFWLTTIMLIGVVVFSLMSWHKGGGNPYAQIPVAILFYGLFWLVAYVTRKAYLKEALATKYLREREEEKEREALLEVIVTKPKIKRGPRKPKVIPIKTPTEEIQQTNTTEKSNDNI